MDSRPQQPQMVHKKDGKPLATRARGTKDFEAMEERKIGNGSKLKFGAQMDIGAQMIRSDSNEVFPIPSSSHADPLNWSRWRKELAFASLMLAAATIGSLKTIFVTVNSVVGIQLNASYTGAAALTGVPLIFGALTGVKSQILSQSIGKRGIYLVSSIMMLLASVWNMHVTTNYAEFMVSRIFQGIGWGAFEALIASSIKDLFFVNERSARTNAYNFISMIFTWGTPILGGYLSQSTESFRNQIMVINIIQAFSIVFLILGTPETSFDRSANSTPPAENTPSLSPMKMYLSTLRLKTEHSTRPFSMARAMQPLKSLYAPSALLTTLLSGPLVATTFGTAQSLSLIFTSMPTFLFPSRLGFIFVLPLIFSIILYTIFSTIVHIRSKPPHPKSSAANLSLALSVPALILAVVGLLSMALYTEAALMPKVEEDDNGTVFALMSSGDISLKTVSALFGILVSASVVLSYTSRTYLSSSPSASTETSMLLNTGLNFWTEMLTGIWTIGMPMWVQGAMDEDMTMVMGFKETGIALGVLSVVLGSSVGAVLYAKGREVGAVDGRVLGRVESEEMGGGREMGGVKRWGSGDSFMEV